MSPAATSTVSPRNEAFFIAKVAEEAERWDDAIASMKTVVSASRAHLSAEERNLVSVAYKNKTGTLRNSWRILDTLERRETAARPGTRGAALIRQARTRVERDLARACQDVLALISVQLLPAASPGEERVFYHKMQGDYYRYLYEIAAARERERYAQLSLEAYKTAYKHALGTLEAWHPTRLGLALNFAVYFRDVCASPVRACHLAKHAFDEALAALVRLPDDASRDSVMILQLLRDDLILWSSEISQADASGNGEAAA
ncbi:14-3-3 domain-containing protein [Vararia minispora EC-137]|uniref:14-3-3 domain-containing protein n=1 Tax=Vararia minispora EC-137 TaxID=1314806 RepID=A0ACB8QL35_9AGAM|nr:14-3-3 domain-containing protein [Vararia minispora EC-137]